MSGNTRRAGRSHRAGDTTVDSLCLQAASAGWSTTIRFGLLILMRRRLLPVAAAGITAAKAMGWI